MYTYVCVRVCVCACVQTMVLLHLKHFFLPCPTHVYMNVYIYTYIHSVKFLCIYINRMEDVGPIGSYWPTRQKMKYHQLLT